MSNQDLLKQAIAEAKTIREAAIANAKEALEESLTPHLKDMLAAKLQEMEEAEVEEEIVNEEDTINDPKGPTAHGNVAEGEEEEEETEEEETEEESQEEETEEEEMEIEDMSVEDLKDLIRDIVAQEVGAEDGEEIQDELPADDMVGAEEEEEIDINELLAELAEMEDKENVEEAMKEPSDSAAAGLDAIISKIKAAAKKSPEVLKKIQQELEKAGSAAGAAMRNEGMEEEDLDEYGAQDMKEPSDAAAAGVEALKGFAKKAGMSLEKFIDVVGQKIHGGKGLSTGTTMYEEELEEALNTVKELRTQLQEVNLLNAKLLYVNKVLKANNLTESQKVNVVTAFDKAETVKEVKLVYETVSKNISSKPATIKEHKSFASKAAGTAKTAGKTEDTQIISEQVARWQKLAGIIK